MKTMRLFIFILVGLCCSSFLKGQNNLSDKKLYHHTYKAAEVIDSVYGITMYEPLNIMLGNDSIRNDRNGYAANGYEEDFYENGQLLHKGFYVEGQAKVYKNYYPNGNMERNFRMLDLKKSRLTLFYEDETVKSNITFILNQAIEWKDYYTNGTLEFIEKYHRSFEYHLLKASYYNNGNIKEIMELVKKKKLEYDQMEYYLNGTVKAQGKVRFDRNTFDYQKIGTWKFFNKKGKLEKIQKYLDGKMQSEKKMN